MFSLLSHLFRAEPAAVPRLPMRRPTQPDHDGTVETDDHSPHGCGWFDSSHDLLSGVTVWEGIIVVDNTVATPS